jgi:hypothetical protein
MHLSSIQKQLLDIHRKSNIAEGATQLNHRASISHHHASFELQIDMYVHVYQTEIALAH